MDNSWGTTQDDLLTFWLHPLHKRKHGKAISPLQLPRRLCSKDGPLTSKWKRYVIQAAQNAGQVDNGSLLHKLVFDGTNLVLREFNDFDSAEEEHVRISCLLADVALLKGAVHSTSTNVSTCTIGLVCRPTPLSPETHSDSSKDSDPQASVYALHRMAWVIVVQGPKECGRLSLDTLSTKGSVRSNLQTAVSVSDEIAGSGGFGTVYVGTTRNSAKIPVAVKIANEGDLDRYRDEAEQEIKILAAVHGHPHIVRFRGAFFTAADQHGEGSCPVSNSSYSAGVMSQGTYYTQTPWASESKGSLAEYDEGPRSDSDANIMQSDSRDRDRAGRWAIVMDLYPCGDLFDHVAEHGPLQVVEALQVLQGILRALVFLHRRLNILHRDVKAANVLLKADLRPILTDFGSASKTDDAVRMAQVVGTPGHSAPEMVLGLQYDGKVDVFSAGVVLYWMVFGSLPFTGSAKHDGSGPTETDGTNGRRHIDEMPASQQTASFTQLLDLLLEKDPLVRPDSMEALERVGSATDEIAQPQRFVNRVLSMGLQVDISSSACSAPMKRRGIEGLEVVTPVTPNQLQQYNTSRWSLSPQVGRARTTESQASSGPSSPGLCRKAAGALFALAGRRAKVQPSDEALAVLPSS